MKSKTLLVAILFSLVLASCSPVSVPVPTAIPSLTTTLTITPIPPTATLLPTVIATQPPNKPLNPSDDCFLSVDFIPEKTRMNEVISVWGIPYAKNVFGKEYEYWFFDSAGSPHIIFKNQTVDRVSFSLKNCSLEKITSKLGIPEKVEITVLISDIDLSTSYIQEFHYTSLGFSFFRVCNDTQNCFIFQANDTVNGKDFYSTSKVIEDSTGFNMHSYVYSWHGFGIDVEKAENKIKDFITKTPTP